LEVERFFAVRIDLGRVVALGQPDNQRPEHTGRSRLLHIHRNVPGVMARVNERLSKAGINVAAQYLSTRDEVGYVVIDVDTAAPEAALADLASLPDTIRCRLLY